MASRLFESVFLALVPQVSFGRAHVYNLGAPVPVFLHLRALLAVVGVRNAFAPANGAFACKAPERALVAQLNEGARSHVAIANYTMPVALLAQAANRNAWLLATEN